MNSQFWSFQSDIANFEGQFLLIHTRYYAEIFRIITTSILQQFSKFLSNSEMGHAQTSESLHWCGILEWHLVWNDPIAFCWPWLLLLSSTFLLLFTMSLTLFAMQLFLTQLLGIPIIQAFIQALLSTAIFPQRFSFFIVCLGVIHKYISPEIADFFCCFLNSLRVQIKFSELYYEKLYKKI